MDRVLQNTALIAAIAAAVGWMLNRIYDVAASRLAASRARRTTLGSILLDRTMVALQEKMQSEQFEALSPDRQVGAVDDWIGSVEALLPKLAKLLAELEASSKLGRSNGQSAEMPLRRT